MKLFPTVVAGFLALASAQSSSPNASISLLEVPQCLNCNIDVQAMMGYPDISSIATLITGPLSKSSFGFVNALNTTSTNFPLTFFVPVNSAFERFVSDVAVANLVYATIGGKSLLEIAVANHILPNISANSTVLSETLASSPSSHHLILDFNYARVPLLTLAGLNITVRGVVQNESTLPVPPLIFAQNALVVKPDAIVAANGVIHLISNIIDPFIGAAGGFFGPTKEVVMGIETSFGPIIKLAIAALNID